MLRIRAAEDAKRLNIKDWGLLVELISPDGIIYNKDKENGEPLKALSILYDRVTIIPETGEDMTVPEPTVTLSRLSLIRIPEVGENWIVKIPESPTSENMMDYMISPTRSPEGGKSNELIRLYLQKVEQKP